MTSIGVFTTGIDKAYYELDIVHVDINSSLIKKGRLESLPFFEGLSN